MMTFESINAGSSPVVSTQATLEVASYSNWRAVVCIMICERQRVFIKGTTRNILRNWRFLLTKEQTRTSAPTRLVRRLAGKQPRRTPSGGGHPIEAREALLTVWRSDGASRERIVAMIEEGLERYHAEHQVLYVERPDGQNTVEGSGKLTSSTYGEPKVTKAGQGHCSHHKGITSRERWKRYEPEQRLYHFSFRTKENPRNIPWPNFYEGKQISPPHQKKPQPKTS